MSREGEIPDKSRSTRGKKDTTVMNQLTRRHWKLTREASDGEEIPVGGGVTQTGCGSTFRELLARSQQVTSFLNRSFFVCKRYRALTGCVVLRQPLGSRADEKRRKGGSCLDGSPISPRFSVVFWSLCSLGPGWCHFLHNACPATLDIQRTQDIVYFIESVEWM